MAVAREIRVPAQVVANAFVQQYYLIQQQSPGLVHRFYQEESKLGRPEDDGTMSTTTTLQAINEKILSLNCGQYRAEITYVDAQESYNGGVHVLVIGYFEGKDNMIIRNFTQTFFLAPQEKGYFVLNDVFRYIEDINHLRGNQNSSTDMGAPLSPKQDQFPVQEIHVAEETKVPVELNREEAPNPSHNRELSGWEEDNEEVSVVEEDYKEVSVVEEVSVPEVIDEVPDESQLVVESQSKIEVPKKSYAAIVMNMKESDVQLSPSPPPRQSVAKSQEQQQENIVQASASVAETPVSGPDAIEDGEDQEEEADGYSIYVKNLPYDITPALLEDEFKRFGAIKSGGIQVRSNQDFFCFGFVEFEVATAAQRAIEASPLSIGGRRAVVEEKRSTCSRVNGYRGRYPTARAHEFRQDGNYGNVRGNTRGDFGRTQHGGFRGGYRGGFSSRGGYQRVDNMGSNDGRMNRGGGMASNGTAKTAAPQVSASA
ncbi:nuclear transport factor 2-like isoform X2 [Rhododendron vialii]|uniref:nuclear transport factor 2-like isoform X2 n=1 Tax=Rhododendron vialii TaxID=182163 RepID=UPI00265EA7FB|nr:nuclear transport factor 2-like isoform X2 [Rhododendron vialii]